MIKSSQWFLIQSGIIRRNPFESSHYLNVLYFVMWCYRRMLRISWTQKASNVRVLQRVARSRELLLIIKKRKVKYLGHVLRHKRYQLRQAHNVGQSRANDVLERRTHGCAKPANGPIL
ncbi:jg5114 [Pararge aegeria aegeria]|uniref:Jg5114 protein n=1 Tax=Pararge aegeria aegeria TaxID=348720 RepID=A0A8S4S311_9NEOP|nr:jg5114 [Pararge aegeria aegeria]